MLTIQQPECLPWLGFFDKIRQADKVVFLDNVQFKKRYFENRNRIRTGDGEAWLTVPVKSKGHYEQKIMDVEIMPDQHWRKKMIGNLTHSYGKAPFWRQGGEELCAIIAAAAGRLVDFNLAVIAFLMDKFGLRRPMMLASSLGASAKGSDLILEICLESGASHYLSGVAGRDYLRMDDFTAQGVKVTFQEFRHPVYSQCHGDFMPGMSALDLYFNCGPDSRGILERANAGYPTAAAYSD